MLFSQRRWFSNGSLVAKVRGLKLDGECPALINKVQSHRPGVTSQC